MDSGLLKYKITLQKPITAKNPYGSMQDVQYADYKTVNANMLDIGGNKMIANFELFTSKICQFVIRYREDIDETFRVKYKDKFYTINNIKDSPIYKESITLTCALQQ
jgi:SPP1 family predicted phage head-tail adaptor